MTESRTRDRIDQTEPEHRSTDSRQEKPISMHEDVPVWHDCCCCEAEPRWVEVAQELGIDLDGDWDAAVDRARADRR